MTDAEISRVDARAHIEMADQILSGSLNSVNLDPWPYIVWGLFGAFGNICYQLITTVNRALASKFDMVYIAIFVLIVVGSVFVYMNQAKRIDRMSKLEGYVNSLFSVAFCVGLIVSIFASQVFVGWGQSALWSLIYGTIMMSCSALLKSRLIFAGGAILILSIVVTNYMPQFAGYTLAGGDLIGLAGVGVVLAAAKR